MSTARRPASGAAAAVVAFATALAIMGAGLSDRAEAKVPIYSFKVEPSTTQAGGRPDILIQTAIGSPFTEPSGPCFCNVARDIIVNTPPGLVANPTDIPQCTAVEFSLGQCPVDSQVGIQAVFFAGITPDAGQWSIQPFYNMEAGSGQLGLLAAPAPIVSAIPVFTAVESRTESDYGLEFKTFGFPKFGPLNGVAQFVWGVPADPSHDDLRWPFGGLGPEAPVSSPHTISCFFGDRNPIPELTNSDYPAEDCLGSGGGSGLPFPPAAAGVPPTPFVQSPSSCSGVLTASLRIDSFDLESNLAEAPYAAVTGCDQLSFDPSLSANPTTTQADSPSGVDVNLTVPQSLSPTTPSPSAIRGVKVTFPEGFTINPNAANGKLSCSDQAARFGTREPAQCPETAKIGTLGVTSASFPAVLPGAVYLGEPLPGNRYRVLLVFDGFSLHVKLAGTATPDPATGQLSVSFNDLPQFNFQDFDMHFFGAERGLLATPEQCGTYAVRSEFVPWAAPSLPNQTSTQFFVIDSGPGGGPCPPSVRSFEPALSTGVIDNTGGAHTEFVFDLTRDDGDQNLSAVDVSTPPGFSAILAGIPYCPDATLAALAGSSYLGLPELGTPACAASQVGTAIASAGAGTRPVSLPGRVYLAGPYKGAPLSLAVVTPAVSGPYDLGNVVVRVAVQVDPTTAQVSAVSDPLPQIIEGIPLRLRRILVKLDRKDFVINPTNCDPFSVDARVFGDQGAIANLRSHFQVANCGALKFEPTLRIKLTGGIERRGHPAIHAVFQAKGGANTRRVSVTLPKGELLDNSHFRTVCTRVDFANSSCPPGSKLGRAEVTTPILDQPLKGSVYLRSSRHPLPDLVLDLEGQVDFEAAARVDSVNGRLRTTFESVPDVPVSRIVLDLAGGSKGLLQNSESLCGAPKMARVSLTGQNGRRLTRHTKLQTACGANRRRGG
jgi:hypothetical protein